MAEEESMEAEGMEEEEEEESDDQDGMDQDPDKAKPKEVFVPGRSVLEKGDGEELEFDPTAYRFLETFTTEHPCLSFDVLPMLSAPCDASPVSTTFVAGTQAGNPRHNAILVGRIAHVKSRKPEAEEEDEESSSSEDEAEEAEAGQGDGARRKRELRFATIPHHGGVNRLRATALGTADARVAAVWNDAGKVQIWSLGEAVGALEGGKATTLKGQKPLHTYAGHNAEGFALDWARTSAGRLASGDNRGRMFVWEMGEGGAWRVDALPLTGHKGSVEEVLWSPSEREVLASCGADGSIGLWDVRLKGPEARVMRVADAHEGDVNVMSWNAAEPHLASGGDDGKVKIWDLRTLSYGEPAAVLSYHTAPITSVEWCPGAEGEGTVLAAASEDDQVSIWDIAVEAEGVGSAEAESEGLPPQLLFMHLGQKEVKELHWARDATGALLSTALDSFNFFRTISV